MISQIGVELRHSKHASNSSMDQGGGKRDIFLRCSIFFVLGGWSPAMELGASLIAIFGLAIFDWGG